MYRFACTSSLLYRGSHALPTISLLIPHRSPIPSECRRSYCAEKKLARPDAIGFKGHSFSFKGKGPITWQSLAITSALLAVMYGAYRYARNEKEKMIEKSRRREIGKSKIGGPFELIDHTGAPRNSSDFLGKWILLYFGFTHCPDVCPDEMEKMAQVYDNLKAMQKTNKIVSEVVPVFITVDPERDQVAEVAEYIKEFHPEFIGLTGSAESVKKACKAFRVYFSAGPKVDETDDYIVDHTIIIYLIDPDGRFVDYYGQSKTAKEVTDSVLVQMGKYHLLK